MNSVFTGKRCMVVGSAPDAFVPLSYDAEVIVAANGAVGLVRESGLNVDVLVTTAYLCRPFPAKHEQESIRTWINYFIPQIWVDTKDGFIDAVKDRCKDVKLAYKEMHGFSPERRNRLVKQACGMDLGKGDVPDRVSTGFFALCLVTISKPSSICIVGLGFNNGGFYKQSWGDSPRYHKPADVRCMNELVKRFDYLTTSEELSDRYGNVKLI